MVEQRIQELMKRQAQAIDAINKHAKGNGTIKEQYSIGEQVWLEGKHLKFPHQKTKINPKRYGPFKIIKAISSVAYQLQLLTSWNIHPIFHASLLLPYSETTSHGPNFTRPPPDLIDGEEEYEVEQIKAHRRKGRSKKLQYLIKWKGYPESDNTWENTDQTHAPDLIKLYHKDNPLQRIKGRRLLIKSPHLPTWLPSSRTAPPNRLRPIPRSTSSDPSSAPTLIRPTSSMSSTPNRNSTTPPSHIRWNTPTTAKRAVADTTAPTKDVAIETEISNKLNRSAWRTTPLSLPHPVLPPLRRPITTLLLALIQSTNQPPPSSTCDNFTRTYDPKHCPNPSKCPQTVLSICPTNHPSRCPTRRSQSRCPASRPRTPWPCRRVLYKRPWPTMKNFRPTSSERSEKASSPPSQSATSRPAITPTCSTIASMTSSAKTYITKKSTSRPLKVSTSTTNTKPQDSTSQWGPGSTKRQNGSRGIWMGPSQDTRRRWAQVMLPSSLTYMLNPITSTTKKPNQSLHLPCRPGFAGCWSVLPPTSSPYCAPLRSSSTGDCLARLRATAISTKKPMPSPPISRSSMPNSTRYIKRETLPRRASPWREPSRRSKFSPTFIDKAGTRAAPGRERRIPYHARTVKIPSNKVVPI